MLNTFVFIIKTSNRLSFTSYLVIRAISTRTIVKDTKNYLCLLKGKKTSKTQQTIKLQQIYITWLQESNKTLQKIDDAAFHTTHCVFRAAFRITHYVWVYVVPIAFTFCTLSTCRNEWRDLLKRNYPKFSSSLKQLLILYNQ